MSLGYEIGDKVYIFEGGGFCTGRVHKISSTERVTVLSLGSNTLRHFMPTGREVGKRSEHSYTYTPPEIVDKNKQDIRAASIRLQNKLRGNQAQYETQLNALVKLDVNERREFIVSQLRKFADHLEKDE